MFAASLAACVPAFIATATSACASAGRVVRAVAGHGDQPPARLVLADQLELRFRSRFGQEIVHAGLGGDGRGRERVVTRDHDRADAHLAQLAEALPDAALDDVLQLNDAEHARALGDHQRRARPRFAIRLDLRRTAAGKMPLCASPTSPLRRRRPCGCCRPPIEVDAAHARLR